MGLSLFILHLLTLPKTQDHPLLSPSVPSALLRTLHYQLPHVPSSVDPSWFGLHHNLVTILIYPSLLFSQGLAM